MVTFEQARRSVETTWPDYDIAPYGYETDSHWLLIPLPERAGGRVPAVSKSTGVTTWIDALSDGYRQDRPVGVHRLGRG